MTVHVSVKKNLSILQEQVARKLTKTKQEMFQKHICPPMVQNSGLSSVEANLSEASKQGIKIYKVNNRLGSRVV